MTPRSIESTCQSILTCVEVAGVFIEAHFALGVKIDRFISVFVNCALHSDVPKVDLDRQSRFQFMDLTRSLRRQHSSYRRSEILGVQVVAVVVVELEVVDT